MTNKNKPLSIIDVQTTSTATPPVTRKTTFNPYTGGVLSNNNDRPTFGKYTMEFRSSTGYTSCEVRFRKSYNSTSKSWSYTVMQIPIPNVELVVRNPNYDIIQAIGFLAFTKEALDGVDNGGNYEETRKIARPQDFYISFKPSSKDVIIKDKVTMDIKKQIVNLFEKYTIYQYLELITGESYDGVTANNILIKAVQDSLINIPIYGEVGFSNDSNSTLDGYFVRNQIVTRFSFDKAYLDNPSLKPFTLSASKESLDIKFKCKNLKKIKFNVYASPTNSFNYVTDKPIRTVEFDVNGLVNPIFSIDMTSVPAPNFNKFTSFVQESELDNMINSRKYFAVKITSVVVSAGLTKDEESFKKFFDLDKDKDTTKTVGLNYNVPPPINATFTQALPLGAKPPYFLNLINGTRKFFFKIVVDMSGIPFDNTLPPRGVKGILLKYINDKSTNSNTLRYYALNDPNVKQEFPPQLISGTTEAWYYYSITDSFRLPSSANNTFKLDIPYSNKIFAYLVDTYFYTSNIPVELENVTRYSLTNYFGDGFLAFDTPGNLIFKGAAFLRGIPRIQLKFKIEYTSVVNPTESSPPAGAKWTTYTKTYRFTIPHVYGNMIDYTSVGCTVYEEGATVPSINIPLAFLFTGISKGGYWVKVTLLDTYGYSAGTTRPYLETPAQLGLYKKYISPKLSV